METVVVFFALEIESGCFEDALRNVRRTQAADFYIISGRLPAEDETLVGNLLNKEKNAENQGSQQVFAVRTGPGAENARRVAQAVLQAHRPDYAISAGFAGGLIPDFKKTDLFFPTEVCDDQFRLITLEAFPENVLKSHEARNDAVQGGRLLTFPCVVQDELQKQQCAREFTAKAVDMETYALADECRARSIPLYCVRAISDSMQQKIPGDIQKLMNQNSFMSQLGAAFRTAVKRPGSIMDMARLRADALKASIRLCEILEKTLRLPK